MKLQAWVWKNEIVSKIQQFAIPNFNVYWKLSLGYMIEKNQGKIINAGLKLLPQARKPTEKKFYLKRWSWTIIN